MSGAKHEHIVGRYVVRTEWQGSTLVYDILNKSGMLVAAGFDALSVDEETAIQGIIDRLYGKDQQRDAA